MATNNIIQSSKLLLKEGLSKIVTNKDMLELLISKINNLDVVILEPDKFVEIWHSFNGNGIFAPGGFTFNNKVYLKNNNLNVHTIIHEMIHGISEIKHDNGYKSGLMVGNKNENYMYGRGFNEAFTEHLTSIITNEIFCGYSQDFQYVIQLFMEISNLKLEDVIELYFKENEWLSDEIIDRFDSSKKSLPNLIIEYDNKTSNGQRKSNPNNIMEIIIDAINNKIDNNISINTHAISEMIKHLNDYYYSVDIELDSSIKYKLSNVLDNLGTYKNKIGR